MPGSVARPSTANTMCLVLKPKQEEYTHAPPLMGSENEREAWRKNRVIQMKLGAYLTEIQQQQQSSARLRRTEEYRFMQEATRRSNVPRSVEMLQQLHYYRQKHFPRARYTYGMHASHDDNHHYPIHHHGVHKHSPLSARALRPHRQATGLNRPKTSATIYRKNLNLDRENDMTDGLEDFDNESLYKNETNKEEIFDLVENVQANKFQPPSLRHTTELPAINIMRDNNFENTFPQVDSLIIGRSSTPKKPTPSIDAARKVLNDNKAAITLPKTAFVSKQRTESTSNSVSKCPPSLQRLNSIDSLNVDASITPLPVTNENNQPYYENDILATESEQYVEHELNTTIVAAGNAASETQIVSDLNLDIPNNDDDIEIVTNEGPDFEFMPPVETPQVKKPLKSAPKRTSFNRIRTEPVMPLRHNITSVLRQERAQYEANQLKVKDYIHKMSKRDTISRSNPREHSAPSRKSSARVTESRTESRNKNTR